MRQANTLQIDDIRAAVQQALGPGSYVVDVLAYKEPWTIVVHYPAAAARGKCLAGNLSAPQRQNTAYLRRFAAGVREEAHRQGLLEVELRN
jgi:hypothetical protein